MRTLITVVILSMVSQLAVAQKNFEGRITYRMFTEKDTSKSKSQIIYLKEDKMFIDHGGNNTEPNSLYDFTKGIAHKFVEDSIIITTSLLSNIFPYVTNKPVTEDSFLNIQGYSCKKKPSVIMPPMNRYFKKIENWFPENLTFKTNVKANFVMPPTIFFNGQTISLKTKMTFSENEKDEKTIAIEAVEISAMPLPDSIFAVPSYMKSMSAIEYANMQMEKLKKSDLILAPDNCTGKSKDTHNQPTKSPATKSKQ